jgi:putative thioredoxin
VTSDPLTFDVDDASFQTDVIDRSHTTPVVIDLWADWCGPCRTLGPMLERAVAARDGDVVLAKVDVDANPAIAQAFRVQSIPAVFGIRDGQVVAQFVGVRPEAEIARFLDDLAPSAADRAVQRARALDGPAREAALREALALEPDHREAAIGLAEALVDADPGAALELVASNGDRPENVAIATLVYSGLTFVAMAQLHGASGIDGAERPVLVGHGAGECSRRPVSP